MTSNIDTLHFYTKHNYTNNHSRKFTFDTSNCKSILSIIDTYDKYIINNHKLLNEELVIILATIRDAYLNHSLQSNQVIFKLSHNKTLLQNDYYINSTIKHIDGFISYICNSTNEKDDAFVIVIYSTLPL